MNFFLNLHEAVWRFFYHDTQPNLFNKHWIKVHVIFYVVYNKHYWELPVKLPQKIDLKKPTRWVKLLVYILLHQLWFF